jgi:hypothetical protein
MLDAPSTTEASVAQRSRITAALLVTCVVTALATQRPSAQIGTPRANPEGSRGTPAAAGVITGLVIAAENALPVRGARVSVIGRPLRPARTGPASAATPQFAAGSTMARAEALTDTSGRFEIGALPDGLYTVNVRPPGGFIAPPPVTSVRIDGGKAAAVTIKVERGGAIEGRVLDADGDPVAGATVRGLSWMTMNGTRRPVQRGSASTNDLGRYRLYGLPAGKYVVTAIVRSPEDMSTPMPGFAPTYFPGTADFGAATRIPVGAGAEVSGIDIPLQSATLASITGAVSMGGGQPLAPDAQPFVSLVSSADDQVISISGPARNPRTFRFAGVAPGDYHLVAYTGTVTGGATYSPARPGTVVPVRVAGANLTVDLELNTGASVSGSVRVEGRTRIADIAVPDEKPLTALSRVSVVPRPLTTGFTMSAMAVGPPARVADNGTFTLSGMRGQFLFDVHGPCALTAVRLNGRDITGTPLDLAGTENLEGLEVVVTTDVGAIRGRVRDRSGRPTGQALVVAIPADPDRVYTLSPFVRSTGTIDTSTWLNRTPDVATTAIPAATNAAWVTGDFEFPRILPGKYRLVAYDGKPGAVDGPDVDDIRKSAASATTITVEVGKTVTVDLKASRTPGSAAK